MLPNTRKAKRLTCALLWIGAGCLAIASHRATAADGGYWDTFVVSLSPQDYYWNQMAGGITPGTLVHPIVSPDPAGSGVIDTSTPLGGVAWAFGGARRGDGVRDDHPLQPPVTISLRGESGYYLSVVLDTLTGPHADTSYPSFGVILVEITEIVDGVVALPFVPGAGFWSPSPDQFPLDTSWGVDINGNTYVNLAEANWGGMYDENATQNMGIYGIGGWLPIAASFNGDPTDDGYDVTFYTDQTWTWDSYAQVPCPPEGAPTHTQTYQVVGDANDTPWSWRIHMSDGTVQDLEDLNVPGVPVGGTALDVAEAFADSINAARDARGCLPAHIDAQAAEVLGTVILSITTGGAAQFDLSVGAAGSDPDCPVTTSLPACTFNPSISEIALPGLDCNGNGIDDFIDILAGTSLDANGNGVPDDCECLADLDGSGAVGFADLLQLLGAWGPCPACAEDLDGSGDVGFADLLILLAAWGPC